MTRDEAIEHIWGLSIQVAGEFCCSNEEREELERETQAAIAALTGEAA
ncbi:hypothetical protein JVX93_21690 [Mycolicibacterium boenickei]|nr:hypothetical protein JVX93_21690 [Mycolicibacterium boenickei]